MTIFITSDTHFGHENIINLCARPFSSVEEMDETLIANWNAVVTPRDTVYHLGDFAYRSSANPAVYCKRLNGRKHLLLGNHDDVDAMNACPWESVQTYSLLKHNKQRFVLFHYPISEWDGWYRGALHLHGHQHNRQPLRAERRIDVGVDANSYTLWSIDDLAKLAERGAIE